MFFKPLASEMGSWQIRSTSKGLRLVDGKGYTYLKDRQIGGKSYWRCDYRPWKCKARASLVGDCMSEGTITTQQVLLNFMSHGHEPSGTIFLGPDFTDTKMDELVQPEIKTKSPKVSPPLPPNDSNSESEMCLRWNSHYANMQSVFPSLMENEKYVDVTLASEGKLIKCHRLILSSCSDYFDQMLKDVYPMQHTVIYLNDTPFWIVKLLVEFMYKGEVTVDQFNLHYLLKAAEGLQIKGLAGKNEKETHDTKPSPSPLLVETNYWEKSMIPMQNEIKKEIPIKSPVQTYTPIIDIQQQKPKKKGPVKKIRKRKSTLPPDPSSLKHVKINLRGTKSRPNIKQPKFYDPDYPEYDPDRSVSSLKIDESFNLDKVKMEVIDFDIPDSPDQNDLNSLIEQSLSRNKKSHSNENESDDNYEPTIKPKQRKAQVAANKSSVFQSSYEDIDLPIPSTSKDNTPTNLTTKIISETETTPTGQNINKKTIIVNVNENTQKTLESSTTLTNNDNIKSPQIRVRNLTTTESVLRRFANANLTSILKRDKSPPPFPLKKVPIKTSVLRHKPENVEVSKLMNTKEDLNSTGGTTNNSSPTENDNDENSDTELDI